MSKCSLYLSLIFFCIIFKNSIKDRKYSLTFFKKGYQILHFTDLIHFLIINLYYHINKAIPLIIYSEYDIVSREFMISIKYSLQ